MLWRLCTVKRHLWWPTAQSKAPHCGTCSPPRPENCAWAPPMPASPSPRSTPLLHRSHNTNNTQYTPHIFRNVCGLNLFIQGKVFQRLHHKQEIIYFNMQIESLSLWVKVVCWIIIQQEIYDTQETMTSVSVSAHKLESLVVKTKGIFVPRLGQLRIVHFFQNITAIFMQLLLKETLLWLLLLITTITFPSVSHVCLLRLGKVALCLTSWMTSLLQW